MKVSFLLFILMAVSLTVGAQGDKANGGADERHIDSQIARLMKAGRVPGMSVAVVRDGKLAWSKGYGVKSIKTAEPVTKDSVFDANSLSKVVFAYAVLTLVDEGKIDLDAPLTKYLGQDPELPDDPRIEQVTVRRILSHSGGLAHVRPEGTPTIPFVFNPGEKFGYSTEGLMMLSKAVEKITRKKTETVINDAVLTPLKMADSSFVWLDKYEKLAVSNHDSFGQPAAERYRHKRGLACCSMLTTAADYAAFALAVMNGKLLKRDTWAEMVKPQITLGDKTPQLSWGLGWGIERTQNDEYLWHWGDNGISKSYVVASLKGKNAVVFLANSDNGLSFAKEVIDLTVGGVHPSLAWLNYDRYDSAGWRLFDGIISNGAGAALKEYLKQRSTDPKTALDESQMNVLGYKFLQSNRTDAAIAVFTQNTVDFPGSANTWDSLAEAYMEKGDKEFAIKYYEKSLQIDPKNANATAMLKKLKGK